MGLEDPLEMGPVSKIGRAAATEGTGDQITVRFDQAKINVVGVEFGHAAEKRVKRREVVSPGLREAGYSGEMLARRFDQTVLTRCRQLHHPHRVLFDFAGS